MKPWRHVRWMPLWKGNAMTPDRLMAPIEGYATRAICKRSIDANWGYIRTRKDLRGAPHFWRVPKPVKVMLTARIITCLPATHIRKRMARGGSTTKPALSTARTRTHTRRSSTF